MDRFDPVALRTRLEAARRQARLTEVQAAEAAGVSQTAINNLESGVTRAPAFATVTRLAAAYGIPLADLASEVGLPLAGRGVSVASIADDRLRYVVDVLQHSADQDWRLGVIERMYRLVVSHEGEAASTL